MAAATLLSAREGSWSTDRETAVELIGRHAPELAHLARQALSRCDPASPARSPSTEILDKLGGWLRGQYASARG